MDILLSTLKSNTTNPRTITDAALQKLCDSIERDPEFMELRPIIVDDDGTILGGNQRYHACLKLGKDAIPDSWVRNGAELTPEAKKRFILIDNAPEGMSGAWDASMLQQEWSLADLKDLGFESLAKALEGIEPDNPSLEWEGMPEFDNPGDKSWKTIQLHFKTKEDMNQFSKVTGCPLTDKAKYAWFPYVAPQVQPDIVDE